MFEILFAYSKVLVRHQAGPAAADRERYLAYCAGQGAARETLLHTTAARQHLRDQPALMGFLRAL